MLWTGRRSDSFWRWGVSLYYTPWRAWTNAGSFQLSQFLCGDGTLASSFSVCEALCSHTHCALTHPVPPLTLQLQVLSVTASEFGREVQERDFALDCPAPCCS